MIRKNKRNRSPKRFQKKAKKELNRVLNLKKKLDIKKNEHKPIISQNKNIKIILNDIR